ncbi:unnamed protein product [Ophioblennius macclurei]
MTPSARWLLSIFVVLPRVFAEGLPLPPSHLVCYTPCVEDCLVDINCNWHESPDNNIHTNYTLYWNTTNSTKEYFTSGKNNKGIISRERAPRTGELHVWVRASNQDGYVDSEPLVFNADDIIKPPPPQLFKSSHEPPEVHWDHVCQTLGYSIGTCEVRHRIEEDKTWPWTEDGVQYSYSLLNPMPWTVYEFQVRCSCHIGLKSEWSAVHKIRSAELAPIGEVDVWKDCGMLHTSSDCYLTWKDLPPSQALGKILAYEVRISYNNDIPALINVSTINPSSEFVHDGKKWYLTSPLRDVSSVSVSAYNELGATSPSFLPLPLKGKQQKDQTIDLNLTENSLAVSWDLPAQLSDNLKEYVVQYKEAGRPGGHGFDWIKITKNKTAEFTAGQFKKYTAYQVSLFQVPHSREVQHFTSAITFSHEKAPPTVPSFKVSSVKEKEVSLVWEPIPLADQGGLILYYQIGNGEKEVHNVSASLHHENNPFKMSLHPGKDNAIWIRAVSAAGPGPKVTARVTTNHRKGYALPIGSIVTMVLIAAVVLGVLSCQKHRKMSALLPHFLNDRVPDPSNSHIFEQMLQQVNESIVWTCIPNSAQDPEISVLEIVEKISQDLNTDGLTGPGVVDGCSQRDCSKNEMSISAKEERDRPDSKHGREEYSKMIDSDEDCLSSDEEQCTSGYEQHFMPTAGEIVGI